MAPEPLPHHTDVRRRKRMWRATCSCGWLEDTVSGFEGWSASRRHLIAAGVVPAAARPRRPGVRLLDGGA